MKSAIVLSMVLALSLSSSSVVAQANMGDTNNAGNTTTQTTRATSVKNIADFKKIPAEITGVIQEISEKEMKVKAQDGEIYQVPLELFSKVEGFKELGLNKDVDVTLKRLKPQMAQTLSIGSSTGGAIIIKQIDGEELIKLDPNMVKGEGIKTESANVTFSITEGAVKGELTTAAAIKAELISGSALNGVITTGEAVTLKAMPGVSGIKTIDICTLDEGKLVFIASEIIANGKTVKLPK